MTTKDADFTTESKEEIRKWTPAGDIEIYYRIWATSKGGTYFHVDVREDELGKANQALAARAKELDSI